MVGDALMEPFWPLGTGANRAGKNFISKKEILTDFFFTVLSAWDTMASLVQIGMLGLTTAEAVFSAENESQITSLVEGAMAM